MNRKLTWFLDEGIPAPILHTIKPNATFTYQFESKPNPNPLLDAIQEQVTKECYRLVELGYEPYLEFYYENGDLKLTVRRRRDDDPKHPTGY